MHFSIICYVVIQSVKNDKKVHTCWIDCLLYNWTWYDFGQPWIFVLFCELLTYSSNKQIWLRLNTSCISHLCHCSFIHKYYQLCEKQLYNIQCIVFLSVLQLFFGGDWLTVERAIGAQRRRLDGDNLYEMLAGLIPKNEDWHAFRISLKVKVW